MTKRPPDSNAYAEAVADRLGFASDVESSSAQLFALDLDAQSQAFAHFEQLPSTLGPLCKHVPYQTRKYLMLSGISGTILARRRGGLSVHWEPLCWTTATIRIS